MPNEDYFFFDKYPKFYSTSNTGAFPNRLNRRYIAEIFSHRDIIKNSTILDLASHDGRWSFAAIKTGAKKIVGIEARSELIKNSKSNFDAYQIPREQYSFIQGNVFDEMPKLTPNSFDIIFCFGLFYHIMNHMLLLSEIKRLNPKFLIFGSLVSPSDSPIIEIIKEDSDNESYGIQPKYTASRNVLVGIPSKLALEQMLENYDFEISYFNWHNQDICDWKHIEDYRDHKRVSLLAKNLSFRK